MTSPAFHRDELLALLSGRRGARVPAFSGLISVTSAGLERVGQTLSAVHHDPERLAAAAATTYELAGLPSAVAPFDLCVEAEALGARVDFRQASARPEFPRVALPVVERAQDWTARAPAGIGQMGRVPVVAETLRLLKERVGREIVIGGYLPGPFTLALQMVEPGGLLTDLIEAPEAVGRMLDAMVEALAEVGTLYRAAGADFLTVHEMGGSPGFIGPRPFERVVLPHLKRLLAALPAPRVLSVCGKTNPSMAVLAGAGAEAISVDQLNDLAQSRATVGAGTLLFGNLDPVAVLAEADEAGVAQAVKQAILAGVDAVWPGCDLWPPAPVANLSAMVKAAGNIH